ncbi:MAG: 4'-phosphopantetheinyl transferase, partial [Bradymonadia bacterium]
MTVDVWMRWREGAPPEDAAETLSHAERSRYESMRSAEAARCFLSARSLVRDLLSEVSPNIPPDAWRFETNSNGKPYVVEPAEGRLLHFNVAHTDGFAIALVSEVAVGVDVENTTRQARVDKVARRFFAESEADWVLRMDDAEKRQ